MAGEFQFVSIRLKDDTTDKARRNRARSHAVKKALESKRRHQQLARSNFVNITMADHDHIVETAKPPPITKTAPLFSPFSGALDPFQSLAVDSSRLQVLLGDYRARQAPEPVFSVADELAFQSFGSVFRTGFDDPALVNAVMLTLSLAVTGGNMDHECLKYQGQALLYIRQRIAIVHKAASEATIGAILLIAGVVARLGQTAQVELHMGAVQQLLRICQRNSVHLAPGIKRAIFWQDLNSSILSGAKRIFDHRTFAELSWTRDAFAPNSYRLPPGFQSRPHIISAEFGAILEDLHALQCIRNTFPRTPPRADAMRMLFINNQTASVQSRLAALSDLSPLQECCRLAAYLCSVTLCCKVWCELVIPSHISSQLLDRLRQVHGEIMYEEDSDLLIWLLYIGGAFAPGGPIRSGYMDLLRTSNARLNRRYYSWSEVHECVRRFIWSDNAFVVPVRRLWLEVSQSGCT
ncbi:hypothetical protein BJY04DRAFT_233340 [Aspergillus karnatakaensis]|uniref:uncharacterized protein n=1 Tax=Aspergillus karnatakaensis TaxID=1810916 RepID=UPI003CCDBFC4